VFPGHRVWGAERPALETWSAILGFAPLVGWLGNPAWWRETLPRLAHYYTLSMQRKASLPDIQVIYFGQVYEFSLPWHNAWVLMGITVPAAVLFAAAIGLFWGIAQLRRDRLPFYFLVHFMVLPVVRMFPTPAHDGVRLFLPTFFFLAAFTGWGVVWLADLVVRSLPVRAWVARLVVSGAVLAPAAFAVIQIHPYELSYYNELIGGPRGAWKRGFELSYWYDAFDEPFIDEINRRLPPHAETEFLNDKTWTSVQVFQELESLGILRGDIQLAQTSQERFPYVWLLTQDSKSSAFTRLLFVMRPWLESEPRQLGRSRVATVADPVAVSRAWALRLLLDAADRSKPSPPAAPLWVQNRAPFLARLWGDGLKKSYRLSMNQEILHWSSSDPTGLLAAARQIASRRSIDQDPGAQRLMELMTVEVNPKAPKIRRGLAEQLLRARPEALVEAVQIINDRQNDVVTVMTRYSYTDPSWIGGYLDRDLSRGLSRTGIDQ
jgi:hypothetical protein